TRRPSSANSATRTATSCACWRPAWCGRNRPSRQREGRQPGRTCSRSLLAGPTGGGKPRPGGRRRVPPVAVEVRQCTAEEMEAFFSVPTYVFGSSYENADEWRNLTQREGFYSPSHTMAAFVD